MREISVELVKKTVEELCVKANLYLPDGMKEKINSCIGCEKSPLSKQVLGDIVRNIDCAKELEVPICQDTGMAVIFLEVGQDVHFTGGNLTEAINEGVANGYVNGSNGKLNPQNNATRAQVAAILMRFCEMSK